METQYQQDTDPSSSVTNTEPSGDLLSHQDLAEQLDQIFRDRHVDDTVFMKQIRDFLLTWHRIIKAKRAYYGNREEKLWCRIYQGLTMESSVLGPTTTDLLPLEQELDERSWRILRAFTGETHMHEYLGIVIDAIYSLFACAQSSASTSQLESYVSRLTLSESGASSQQKPVETVPSGLTPMTPGAHPFILSSPDPVGTDDLNLDAPLPPPDIKSTAEHTPYDASLAPYTIDDHQEVYSHPPLLGGHNTHPQLTADEQHCIEQFLLPCRKILHEMILQYLQITDTHDSGMLGIIEDLVESVADVVDNSLKPESETNSGTVMFRAMMMGFAQDQEGRRHMDPLIDAMKNTTIGPAAKERIGQAWVSLLIECRRERLQEFQMHELSDSIKEKADTLLLQIAKTILEHDKDMMKVLHHASAISMPYSGGFSYTLAQSAKSVALAVFWDKSRSAPTFNTKRWQDLKVVFPYLCDLLGPLTLGRIEILTTDYEIVLENVRVDLKNVLPEQVAHKVETQFHPAGQEVQVKAGESVYNSTEVCVYIFKPIKLSLNADYVYTKKTGIPTYMDYGQVHSSVHNAAVAIELVSTAMKPLFVRRSECSIGDLTLHFKETQHGFLNTLQKATFKRKITAVLKEATLTIIERMVSQLELALL